MLTRKESATIKKIVKRHGAVIDLENQPELLLEIIRNFGDALYRPEAEPGEPNPPTQKEEGGISNAELMKALLKILREVNAVKVATAGKKPLKRGAR